MLIIAGIAASLGCCCPVPGPIVQPPPIVIQEQPLIVQGPDLAAQRAEELKKVIAQNLGPNKEAGTLAANNTFWARLKTKLAKRQFHGTELVGPGARVNPTFTDTGPEAGVLIGVFACQDDGGFQGVCYLQPIFLTAQGEKVGTGYGAASALPVQCLKAKAGYAVGGIKMRAGAAIDQVQLVYVKVDGEKLNLADQYLSPSVGGDGGGPMEVFSKGVLVIGVHGTRADGPGFSGPGSATSLGLLLLQ
jgi:hypothetical protein